MGLATLQGAPSAVNRPARIRFDNATDLGNEVWAYCRSVSHGFKVQVTESEVRDYSYMYSHRVTSSSFSCLLQFPEWDEYNRFNTMLLSYQRNASAGLAPLVNFLIPEFRRTYDDDGVMSWEPFYRIGIPTSGGQFGDVAKTLVYSVALSWEGASDPIDIASLDDNFLDDPESDGLRVSQVVEAEDLRDAKRLPTSHYVHSWAEGVYGELPSQEQLEALSQATGIPIHVLVGMI